MNMQNCVIHAFIVFKIVFQFLESREKYRALQFKVLRVEDKLPQQQYGIGLHIGAQKLQAAIKTWTKLWINSKKRQSWKATIPISTCELQCPC